MGERVWWGQGDGSSLHAVPTEAGRVGALICWEHWMPLTRAALHATSEDIHVAAWPRVRTLLALQQIGLPACSVPWDGPGSKMESEPCC